MNAVANRWEQLNRIVVTADQMRAIESSVFEAGMPVPALMELVGDRIAQRIVSLYDRAQFPQVGVLVGPGHNGGDALVVARELARQGYKVRLYQPSPKAKDLTAQHAQYAQWLGLPFVDAITALQACDLIVDGLFGFGLDRAVTAPFTDVIEQVNQWSQPVLSLDVPSGIHTDTGAILGTAIKADRTFCIGLWKLGLLQEQALASVGTAELIDWGVPLDKAQPVLRQQAPVYRTTHQSAIEHIPLHRPRSTYKYKMGSLLLICGSRRYSGGATLTSLGARASGVGMLYIAVPASLQMLMSDHLPEALILPCPETDSGAIAQLPDGTDLSQFDTIACGPGLTPDAKPVVEHVLASDRPLVLDADGLNVLAHLGTVPTLSSRQALTLLTPHQGEFKRLFPDLAEPLHDRTTAVRSAAQQTSAIVLLKGARTIIADASGTAWINPESTPALARGGSGDVLTGLAGGLIAQAVLNQTPLLETVQSAVWWHAQAGILAAQERTELGVDAFTLTQFLIPALQTEAYAKL